MEILILFFTGDFLECWGKVYFIMQRFECSRRGLTTVFIDIVESLIMLKLFFNYFWRYVLVMNGTSRPSTSFIFRMYNLCAVLCQMFSIFLRNHKRLSLSKTWLTLRLIIVTLVIINITLMNCYIFILDIFQRFNNNIIGQLVSIKLRRCKSILFLSRRHNKFSYCCFSILLS
jgi:hypothetical protein